MLNKTTRTLALAALLFCAACANQTTTKANLNSTAPLEVSSVRWEEVTAAKQVAGVSNGNLIFMR